MEMYHYGLFIINICLSLYIVSIISLKKKETALRKEDSKLLMNLHNLDSLKEEIKKSLETNNEIQTIHFLKIEKGMSFVDAKQLVNSVQNNK
ncbi:hypothetical protein [Bacillus toyonensis]|uniref:Uncharacterized protein n=1 Tax=Bacillus toyonensis TaxID=155322 RepID=A0A2A8HK51_9BACI|nr:hypothetical protein [Bacillus toyonensis]PEQ09126.1 hypothetical protein CN585_05575 [Bacillus toyonensis]